MLKELVTNSRSRRTFKSGCNIPHGELVELVELTRACPAAMNLQPLKYRIVDTADEVSRLLLITRWASSLSIKLPPEGHGPCAFIVICLDKTLAEPRPLFSIDVGIVAQTMMLGAAEKGYGGCIIGSAAAERIREVLGLDAHIEPQLILGLGVPDENVELTDAVDGDIKYYRDESNTHYVPKRPLSEILL